MEKSRMTIHRALSELKLIDAKIDKGINEFTPAGVYQKGHLANGNQQIEQFNSSAKGTYDSVRALIDRKSSIKTAIVKANAETIVSVAGKSMTIADAITAKMTVDFKKKLIVRMKAVRNHAMSQLEKNNTVVDANCQKLLEATFGKDNVKVGPSDVEAIQKPYLENNRFQLLDPLNVDNKIAEMEKEVSDFEMEVDAVLSEVNAITFIEV